MSNLLFPLDILAAHITDRAPYRKVQTYEAIAGNELRNTWWLARRVRYTVQFDVTHSDQRQDFQRLESFVDRHFDSLDSFLLQDPEDSSVTDHGFGIGDAATTSFQLQRSLLGQISDTMGGPWAVSSKPRKNLVIRSQAFDNAAWTKTHTTITATAAVAPDNTQTGEKLVEDATNNVRYIDSTAISLVSGQTYTHSVFVKSAERSIIVLLDTLSGAQGTFSAFNGSSSFAGGATGSMIAAGNGWYRCSITFVAGSSASSTLRVYLNSTSAYAGDGTSGAYIWGAQGEQFASPTQYIATAAAAVTVNPAYWPLYSDGFGPVYELAGGTRIFVNGVEKVMGTDFTLPGLGVVTFTSAPASNAVLSWTGGYYIRCRWDTPDGLLWKWVANRMWSAEAHLVSTKPSL